MDYLYYKAINWDEQEDQVDQATWLKLTNNFWLDTRVPITDDQPSWHALTAQQQAQVGHALAGRALLSAFQSELGEPTGGTADPTRRGGLKFDHLHGVGPHQGGDDDLPPLDR